MNSLELDNEIENKIFQNLRQSRYFKEIPDDMLLKFLKISTYKTFKKGEEIIKQDQPNQQVYFIVEGVATVRVDGQFIYFLKRYGDIFGEMSVITDKKSSATIEACSDMELISISKQSLQSIQDDETHELHHLFYKWFTLILSEKVYLTSQKAKLHEENQRAIEMKNQQLEHTLDELKETYKYLEHTKAELDLAKKVFSLTETFKKFVPEQFLDQITKEGLENIKVGSATSDFITILFSDIRAFTNFAENLTVQEVFNFLNAYFSRMCSPIHSYHGFIDKFIGDGIMAIFNQPEKTDSEEAENAVRSALDMLNIVENYNIHRQYSDHSPIRVGIGIHSGNAMMGTIGSETRMDFTVIGDTVNLTSRLENLTKFYNVPIIISADTYKLLPDISYFNFRELDIVTVKGKHKPTEIFEVFPKGISESSQQKANILEPYYLGLFHYRRQEWSKAIEAFQECVHQFPDDKVSEIYLKRSQDYKDTPPSEGWEMVFSLTEK